MGSLVVLINKLFYFRNQGFHAFERTAANGPLGDDIKPDLDLIQP
jgi:hypothetical protein